MKLAVSNIAWDPDEQGSVLALLGGLGVRGIEVGADQALAGLGGGLAGLRGRDPPRLRGEGVRPAVDAGDPLRQARAASLRPRGEPRGGARPHRSGRRAGGRARGGPARLRVASQPRPGRAVPRRGPVGRDRVLPRGRPAVLRARGLDLRRAAPAGLREQLRHDLARGPRPRPGRGRARLRAPPRHRLHPPGRRRPGRGRARLPRPDPPLPRQRAPPRRPRRTRR